MVRLVILLLGVDYLRSYWRTLTAIGVVGTLCGSILFIDALDDALYFPINPFAWLLLIEGSATLVVAHSGIVGQRKLRYLKGLSFVTAASLILAGHHHGNFILSMIFGTLFLADGLLQIVSAYVVRYRTFRIAMFGGRVEIALAVFFFQPYPTHYIGTVPYCLGLGLFFAGWNMLLVAGRARRMISNPALNEDADRPMPGPGHTEQTTCERPTGENARPLIVHIWTPLGVANAEVVRRPSLYAVSGKMKKHQPSPVENQRRMISKNLCDFFSAAPGCVSRLTDPDSLSRFDKKPGQCPGFFTLGFYQLPNSPRVSASKR